MQKIETTGWLGKFDIIIKHKNGTIEKHEIKNRITNAGLNMLRDGLNGDIGDIELKYLALGDSDIALDDDMTTLGNEQFRTTFVSSAKPSTGQIQKTALVLDDEAVFEIEEIGIFAGAEATSSSDTGIMVSRILWNRNKTNLESIQFVRTDTIERG